MSLDFNSIINSAMSEANRKRTIAASVTQGIVKPGTMKDSTLSSELSMEDIANAMKAKGAKKHADTEFITTHGKRFKVNNEKETTPEVAAANAILANTQDKINEIKVSTDKSLNRQSEIKQSLKSYQKNPFIT